MNRNCCVGMVSVVGNLFFNVQPSTFQKKIESNVVSKVDPESESDDTFSEDVEMLGNPHGKKNLLGSGTYAATYKEEIPYNMRGQNAFNLATAGVVAVKKFFPDDDGNDFNIRTLHNERKILEKLVGHKHVVTFYSHANNFLYMEYLGEQNLNDWWDDGQPMDWKNHTLLQILRGLSSALVFLTENDIIHFDIKADNIMLKNNDPAFPVLIDFGRSYEMSGAIVHDQDWGTDGPPCGAYCCQPPEILKIVDRHYHRRPPMWDNAFNNTVDVYCTGVLVFRLFCDKYPNGFFPSNGEYALPLLEKTSKRGWASNEKFAKMELRGIATQMLSENYMQRSSAQDVLAHVDLLFAATGTVVA